MTQRWHLGWDDSRRGAVWHCRAFALLGPAARSTSGTGLRSQLRELGNPSHFQKPLTESHCQARGLPEFRVYSPALLSLAGFTEAPGTELFVGEWERRTPFVCAVAVTHTHGSPAGQPWEETGSPPGRGLASQPSLDGHAVRSGAWDPETPPECVSGMARQPPQAPGAGFCPSARAVFFSCQQEVQL